MRFSIHFKQRAVLLVAAAFLAGTELYQFLVHGDWGLRGVVAYTVATVCAFVALRAPQGPCEAPRGMPGVHLPEAYVSTAAQPGQAASQSDQATAPPDQMEESDQAQVDRYHAIIVFVGQRLYEDLLDRFDWRDGSEERSHTARQIFSESCIILGYYLVSLSLSGAATQSLLRRIDSDLKLRTTATIIGLDGKCAPKPGEEMSPTCKALSAHNLSLLDSFRHLFARTLENFRRGHPYPLNDLLGGIFMLFEGHVPPEPDYWEQKYGDAVYSVIDEIAAQRREVATGRMQSGGVNEVRQ